MLGFVRTDNQSLVWCLGDPPRAVAAYHELLRRGKDATGAIRAGLHHQNPAVREGCCRLLDHLVDTDSMSQLIAMTDDSDAAPDVARIDEPVTGPERGILDGFLDCQRVVIFPAPDSTMTWRRMLSDVVHGLL
jgi:hypothetical protein